MNGFLRPDSGVPGVQIAVSLRGGPGISQGAFQRFNLGMHCGDDPVAVAHNRAQLHSALQLPEPPRWLRQVHGTTVVSEPGDLEPEGDAALTRHRKRVLAVLTADCLPVVIYDDAGSNLAVVHAGWRGLAAGVIEAAVRELAVPGSRLRAWLGPAAGPLAYEVGEEVRSAFVDDDAAAEQGFAPTRPGHWLADLYRLARQRLARVDLSAVLGGEYCTISDPTRFFSHRRDGRSGRMATLAWLE